VNASTAPRDAAEPDARRDDMSHTLWRRPQRLGYTETLRGLGGVVAPLLTGFSLATIAALVSADDPPPLADWAILALALTMALLLFSMQVAFLALARNPSPAEVLNWAPEATVSEDELEAARVRQSSDFHEMSRLWNLAGPTYDLGVLAFLAALALLLIPDTWSESRIAAICVGVVALLGEGWWTLANRRLLPHPVVRKVKSEMPEHLSAVQRAAVLGRAAGDERLDPSRAGSRNCSV
jgi:hypothetical protein